MRLLPLLMLAVAPTLTAAVAAQGVRDRSPVGSGRKGEAITPAEALVTFDSVWHRVRNVHYDTAMRGIDWNRVRDELRPRAERSTTVGELRGVLTEMLGRLGESHYVIIPEETDAVLDASEPAPEDPDAAAGDVGLTVRLLGSDVVVARVAPGGPAARAGVKAGWIVDSVGPVTARELADAVAALRGDAERREALFRLPRRVDGAFAGRPGSVVRAAFRDGRGRRVVVAITRRATPGELVRFPNLPPFMALLEHERLPLGAAGADGCVGVIRFNIWMTALLDDVDRAVDTLRDCRGVVIDLRGNPGGLGGMVMGVGGHFLDSLIALGTLRTRQGEIRFVVNPRRVSTTGRPVRPYAGPLAILVDPLTASTSEVFAAGMQAVGRARVFGETSAGHALPAMATRLPTGDVLLHVTADFVAPDGRRIEGRGAVPDEPVALRREDLLAGRDAALDAAVRWIAGKQ